MPVNAGTAYVKIEPDFSAFRRKVHEEVKLRPVVQEVGVKVNESSLRGATKSIKEHSKVYEGLHSTVLGTTAALVGGGGLVEALVESVKAGAAEETAVARLGKAVSNAGISWKGHREEIETWIKSTARAKGFMDTDLSNAFANMIRTTGSVTEAQTLLNDAMDISRTKGTDLAGAQSLLARVYNGSYIGLKRLGIAITPVKTEQDKLAESTKHATIEQKDHAKQLDALATRTKALGLIQEKFGGQAAVYANTSSGHYARLKVSLDQVEETIGKTLLPTLDTLAKKGVKAAGDFQKHWPEIKKDIKDVVGPIKDVGGAVVNFAKANPDIAKAAISFGLIAGAAVRMKDSALGRSIGALLNLTKLAGVRLPGALGGTGGGKLTSTVADMNVDVMYVKTMVGGGGGGPGGPLSTAERDVTKGAGEASLATRLKTFLRGSPESPAGAAASFAKLAERSPLAAAALPVVGVSVFSAMSKADNNPLAKFKAAVQAVDPTQALNLIGVPSFSQWLLGDPSAQRKSWERVTSGHPMTKGWSTASLGAIGAPVPKQTASAAQTSKDFLAMNTQLSKLETHQQTLKATAFNLDWLAKQAKKVGDVKWTFADRLGAEMVKTRGVGSRGIQNILKEVGKLAPGARKQAELAMVTMSKELQTSGKVPEGTTQKLVNKLVDHFADLQKGAKKHTDQMVSDVLNNIKLIGTKGTPVNAHTRDTLLGQFEDLRKRGGDKFNSIKTEAIQAFKDLQGGVVPTGDATATALYNAFQAMGVNANELASALGIKPIKLKLTKLPGQQFATPTGAGATPRGVASRFAKGALLQIGQPGAAGQDTVPMNVGGVPILVGAGEQVAVFNRHQQAYLDQRLAREGGLTGFFNKVNRPNYMAQGGIVPRRFATGGTFSYGQLEGLWDQAGGPPSYASLMAAIALAESGGNSSIVNSIGASGLWQIHPAQPGDLDPLTNARMAVGKLRSQGLSAWTTYTSGAYRQFLHGGVPALGGVGAVADIARAIISGPPGIMKTLAQGGADKGRKEINDYLKAHAPAPGGGGVLTAGVTGAGGLGTFDGLRVANWIIPILDWARSHGWSGHITSGYRPGAITNTGSLSNHAKTSYPGGAVDVGDQHAIAQGQALWDVVSNYPGMPKLYSAAFGPGAWGPYKDSPHDYGHFSATGHTRGGLVRMFAPGGMVSHGRRPPGGLGATPKPWWQTALGELKKGTHLTKGPKLDKLLGNLRNLGLSGWDKPLAQHGGNVARDQALQQVASGLIDTNAITDLLTKDPTLWPDPTKPITQDVMHSILHRLGTSVQGKDALQWLTQQLIDQMLLRRTLINLARHVRTQYDERKKILAQALRRRKELQAEIKRLNTQLHPPGKHAKPPKGAERKRLQGQLSATTRQLAATQSVITVTQNQMGNLSTAWGADLGGGSLQQLYNLYGPTSSGGQGTQDALGQLYQLQGPVTNNRIFGMGSNAQALIDALPGSLNNWYGDIGTTLGSMSGFGSNFFTAPTPTGATAPTIDPFSLELQRLQSQRDLLGQLQFPAIAYGGSFAAGGTVPGPPGMPVMITAHGGEQVISLDDQSAGGHTFEIHGDPRTVAVLEQLIERVNVRSNRGQARSADRRMRLPGNSAR